MLVRALCQCVSSCKHTCKVCQNGSQRDKKEIGNGKWCKHSDQWSCLTLHGRGKEDGLEKSWLVALEQFVRQPVCTVRERFFYSCTTVECLALGLPALRINITTLKALSACSESAIVSSWPAEGSRLCHHKHSLDKMTPKQSKIWRMSL